MITQNVNLDILTGVLNPNNQYKFIEWSTATYLRNSFSPRLILRFNRLHLCCKSDLSKPSPKPVISKKHFRMGGMAPSEWTRSVRGVRDTSVADHTAPGIKTTRCVTYRPPIAVLPFLLTLSFSCFNQTLWRCAQLWPYVGLGALGTRLHRDCNAMGDAATISPRVPSTLSSRRAGKWEDMILPSREDPPYCVDPRNLGQSEWDQKLEKIECEFSLYDKRRWKWDDVYLLRGLQNIYSPSLCPPPLPL